jgi:hypothetical protein
LQTEHLTTNCNSFATNAIKWFIQKEQKSSFQGILDVPKTLCANPKGWSVENELQFVV